MKADFELPRSSIPRTTAWVVGSLFLLAALVPYAVIGESWGMVWIYVTAPLSFLAESTVGIGPDSWLLIASVSLASAVLWSASAYGICCWILALGRHFSA